MERTQGKGLGELVYWETVRKRKGRKQNCLLKWRDEMKFGGNRDEERVRGKREISRKLGTVEDSSQPTRDLLMAGVAEILNAKRDVKN